MPLTQKGRDPRLNAVASLKPTHGSARTRYGGRDPRLNAVASLKLRDFVVLGNVDDG